MPKLKGLVFQRSELARILLDEIQIGCTWVVMVWAHSAIKDERTSLTPNCIS
jgi:hypothetical protein